MLLVKTLGRRVMINNEEHTFRASDFVEEFVTHKQFQISYSNLISFGNKYVKAFLRKPEYAGIKWTVARTKSRRRDFVQLPNEFVDDVIGKLLIFNKIVLLIIYII